MNEEIYEAILADLRKLWPTATESEQVVLDKLIVWYVRRRNKARPIIARVYVKTKRRK